MARFVPLLIFLLLCVALGVLLVRGRTPTENALVGQRFPAFETTALGGGVLTQQALQGRVAVVNVFASWCEPCLMEHSELMAVHRQFPDVVMLGIGWMDTPDNIAAMLKMRGSPYTQVGVDVKGALTAPLGITGVPETYVIDADGIVRAKFSAPVTQDMLALHLRRP